MTVFLLDNLEVFRLIYIPFPVIQLFVVPVTYVAFPACNPFIVENLVSLFRPRSLQYKLNSQNLSIQCFLRVVGVFIGALL